MTVDIARPATDRQNLSFIARNGKPLLVWLFTCLVLSALHFYNENAWIGIDNDDAMRMVQIRDLIAGQGWFDMWQYRLGPDGGTSMHWSRLIDAPIALLVLLFSLLLSATAAEQTAVFFWPLLTAAPVFVAMAIAGRRLGGEPTVLPVLLLTGFFVFQFGKFAPGSIDHHNVQLALMAIMFAALIDRRLTASSFAVGGVSAGLALAIGAETLPMVAVACAWIAILWIIHAEKAVPAIKSFSLSFCLTLAAAYFATVPPSLYGAVQCDAYSSGFYLLGTVGSGMLYLAVGAFGSSALKTRAVALSGIGIATALAVLVTAPHCLTTEVYDIDPLLRRLWLNHVSEAHSVLDYLMNDPSMLMKHHLVPGIAIIVCFTWLRRSERTPQLLATTFMLVCAYIISLFQVRGAVFAMLFACAPMAVLIARQRAISVAEDARPREQVLYIASILVSVPVFWFAVAAGITVLTDDDPSENVVAEKTANKECISSAAYEILSTEPKSMTVSISNLGAWILLNTPHRTLSAPYHRNSQGMLDAVKIGTADPVEAKNLLAKHSIDILVFCAKNTETDILVKDSPDGLYAHLLDGRVPDYLTLIESTGDEILTLYSVAR